MLYFWQLPYFPVVNTGFSKYETFTAMRAANYNWRAKIEFFSLSCSFWRRVSIASLGPYVANRLAAHAETTIKHSERVKPSYREHFDILTSHFDTINGFFLKLVGWGIWKDAYGLCPSLFPPFFAFPPLARLFSWSALTESLVQGICRNVSTSDWEGRPLGWKCHWIARVWSQNGELVSRYNGEKTGRVPLADNVTYELRLYKNSWIRWRIRSQTFFLYPKACLEPL